jgi:hypothetical protein
LKLKGVTDAAEKLMLLLVAKNELVKLKHEIRHMKNLKRISNTRFDKIRNQVEKYVVKIKAFKFPGYGSDRDAVLHVAY